jgi:hypothetical protein
MLWILDDADDLAAIHVGLRYAGFPFRAIDLCCFADRCTRRMVGFQMECYRSMQRLIRLLTYYQPALL